MPLICNFYNFIQFLFLVKHHGQLVDYGAQEMYFNFDIWLYCFIILKMKLGNVFVNFAFSCLYFCSHWFLPGEMPSLWCWNKLPEFKDTMVIKSQQYSAQRFAVAFFCCRISESLNNLDGLWLFHINSLSPSIMQVISIISKNYYWQLLIFLTICMHVHFVMSKEWPE